jgi:alpha-1,2-mannosyltransferase
VKRIFGIVFLVFSFLIASRALFLPGYPDFAQYYYGFQLFQAGINPFITKGQMFTATTYPPFVSMLFAPLSLIPFLFVQKIWTAIMITLLPFSIYLIFKINNKKFFTPLGFVILGLSYLYFPVRFTLGMGQINILIFFLVVLSIYLLNINKSILSGLSLALPFAIKFFPVLFVPYLLVIKKNKILSYSLLFFLVFTVIGFMLAPALNIFYFEKIFPSLLSSWKTDYYNQSLTGFIGRFIVQDELRNILRVLISLLIIIVSFIPIFKYSKKTKERINLELSLLVSVSLIANNFSWQHHFVLLLFPLITLFLYIFGIKLSFWYYFFIGLSFLLTTLNLTSPSSYHVLAQSHVFY